MQVSTAQLLHIPVLCHYGSHSADENLPEITPQHVLTAVGPVGIKRDQAIRLAYRLNLPNDIINQLIADHPEGTALAVQVIMKWQQVDEGGTREQVHNKLATALKRCQLGRSARRMQLRERAMSQPEGNHALRQLLLYSILRLVSPQTFCSRFTPEPSAGQNKEPQHRSSDAFWDCLGADRAEDPIHLGVLHYPKPRPVCPPAGDRILAGG